MNGSSGIVSHRVDMRDLENRTVVGGLRRPVESLARVPGLRDTGSRVRQCLEHFLEEHPQTVFSLSRSGRLGEISGTAGDATDRNSRRCTQSSGKFSVLALERAPLSSWRPQLVRAFVREANDPEQHLASWLQHSAPIGVARPVPEIASTQIASAEAASTKIVQVERRSCQQCQCVRQPRKGGD